MEARNLSESNRDGARVLGLLPILVMAIILLSYFFLATTPQAGAECNALLSSEVGTSGCLQPLTIAISATNSSQFSVPVLVMQPGTVGTIEILYHISASGVNHQGNLANLSATNVPVALSLATARENTSLVSFSDGSLLFQNKAWELYSYRVSTSPTSDGYYAILPPFYYGIYPALAVVHNSQQLNASSLSLFGFTGMPQSGEFVIPSTIVGTSGLTVVNASVPTISYCPNSACVLITRSLV